MKEYERLQRENQYLKQLLMKIMHNQSTTDFNKIVTKMSSGSNE
ncbi:cell shape-determining protein MreC [Cytobacillus eiseniae]|uniref:Cell shape-determining protein MreC n=1 Tax=Cytobacillus eiseniae TaxID=762947 RepID=A0ABS4RHY3_9BACI|nr:cell shape-determining protein MreC [Cytobacillus eiseniae]